jgi:hypothetical protein
VIDIYVYIYIYIYCILYALYIFYSTVLHTDEGVHVTSDLVSADKKAMYRKVLRSDKFIGPLLLIIEKILDDRS